MEWGCFVSSPTVFDAYLFNLWLNGATVDEAQPLLQQKLGHKVNQQSLKNYVLCQYENFEILRHYLQKPRHLHHQHLFPLSLQLRSHLIERYYRFDHAVVRELLGKQLNSRLRKDMDDVSEKTRVSLGSCRRQFDNLKRIFKKVEDMEGSLYDNIQAKFLLPPDLAANYAHIIFISSNRIETSKKKLSVLSFADFSFLASVMMRLWTPLVPGHNHHPHHPSHLNHQHSNLHHHHHQHHSQPHHHQHPQHHSQQHAPSIPSQAPGIPGPGGAPANVANSSSGAGSSTGPPAPYLPPGASSAGVMLGGTLTLAAATSVAPTVNQLQAASTVSSAALISTSAVYSSVVAPNVGWVTQCGTDLDVQLAVDARDVRGANSERELLDEWRSLTYTELVRLGRGGSLIFAGKSGGSTVKGLVRGVLNIGSGLGSGKEARGAFVDVVEDIVEPCKAAGLTREEFEVAMVAVERAYANLEGIDAKVRQRCANSVARVCQGVRLMGARLYPLY